MIDPAELALLKKTLDKLAEGFDDLPDFSPDIDVDALSDVLERTAIRMQDNYPYFHPMYAGQMLKPPHPVARIAYAMAMWINPNNHALDGGKASSALEHECVNDLARMFGWNQSLGHLTGGGTMANLEALWVGGQLYPGKKVIASSQAHYTHSRISEVLGIPFEAVQVDGRGRMDIEHIESLLKTGEIGTVVATTGTTGMGAVDPLHEILALREKYDFRLHADAAYGGYFSLARELDEPARMAFDAISAVDSIVIDPHKHGLQPYGCGCVLFNDPEVGQYYKHDSPFTYFSSAQLHLGEISLECSRPGASAVALWATMQLLPLVAGGEFARALDQSLLAARELRSRLGTHDRFVAMNDPELDIVVYAVQASSASEASRRACDVFDAAASENLHLAMMDLPSEFVAAKMPDLRTDEENVTCLRSVLMKPEHEDWLDKIVDVLDAAVSR